VSSDAELLATLEARVAERRAAGDYELEWLDGPLPHVEISTPVDAFLRAPPPALHTDLATEGGRGGAYRMARQRIVGWSLPTIEAWHGESGASDARLRDALAWLKLRSDDEARERERLTDDVHEDLADLRSDMRDALVRVRAGLHTATAAIEGRLAELSAVIAVIGPRIAQIERILRAERVSGARVGQSTAASTAAPAPTPADPATVGLDYLAFEDRFRGTERVIRERQRHHLQRFSGCRRVADLGCGRGEFLRLLQDAGIEAIGVDQDAEMVAAARETGARVEHADLFRFLAEEPEGALDGILCSHVVEHLPAGSQARLLRLAAGALRPGGVIVIETPNPLSLMAGSINFHRDPTHLKPVHPDTLAFMLEQAGFEDLEGEMLSSVPKEHRLAPLAPQGGALGEVVEQVNAVVRRLDEIVYGDQEYAVVGRRER
jgi:O-antigen chain-terminating methyltransferase